MSCLVRFEQTYFILNISLYNLLSSGAEGVIKTGTHTFKGLIALIFMEKLRKFLASLFLVSEKNEGVNE
ncbi:hypothetical protein LCGT_0599 [Lactococcus garvieae ATCC 49156]|uniref:Uncharacterized protein n=1 Tax=Lactococcus garvieae (strain Lg2) TaxID=420890 RepID=F9VCM7_LACGL|nr:hypothetical protein LCGT_0599 [Lactococcus garvieae ATCC 49156]BAK60078.1 hypothetical protein LCGL_0618 [Lactococcus garvieae Lg2]